jgi:hypothetical protein
MTFQGSSRLIVPLNSGNATIVEYTQVPFVVTDGDLYLVFFPSLKKKGSNENVLTSFKFLNLPEELTHLSFSASLIHDGRLCLGSDEETWRLSALDHFKDQSSTIISGCVHASKNGEVITIVDSSDAISPVYLQTKWPQKGLSLVLDSNPKMKLLPKQKAIVARFHDSGHLLGQTFESPITVMYQMSDTLKTSVSYQLEMSRLSTETPQSQEEICVYKTKIDRLFTIVNNSNDVAFNDAREIVILDGTVDGSSDNYSLKETREIMPYHSYRASMAAASLPPPSSSSSSYVKSEGYEPPTRPTYEHFIASELNGTVPPFVINQDSTVVLRSTNIQPSGNAFLIYEANNLSYDTASDVSVKVTIWMRNEDVIHNVVSTAPTDVHVSPPPIITSDGRTEVPIDDAIYSRFVWNRDSEKGTLDSWTRVDLPETQNKSTGKVSLIVESENTDRNTGKTKVDYRIRTYLKSPFVLCVPINPQVDTKIEPHFSTFPLTPLDWENDSRIKYHTLSVPYDPKQLLTFSVVFTPLK